jgi:hypothetical protein
MILNRVMTVSVYQVDNAASISIAECQVFLLYLELTEYSISVP